MTKPFILVEDDDFKAKPIIRFATRAGFDPILRATNLVEAFDLIERFGGVVLTDWCFPVRKGREAADGTGEKVVYAAKELGLPIRVYSGRDVPAPGFEDIWFDSASSVHGLMAWLEKEGKHG